MRHSIMKAFQSLYPVTNKQKLCLIVWILALSITAWTGSFDNFSDTSSTIPVVIGVPVTSVKDTTDTLDTVEEDIQLTTIVETE